MKSGPSCVHLKKDPLMRSRKFLLAAALHLAGAAPVLVGAAQPAGHAPAAKAQ